MSDHVLNQVDQIEELFHSALERSHSDRESYLRDSCNSNTVLYQEVCSLLSEWERNDNFLDQPAFDLGIRVLAEKTKGRTLARKTIGPFRVLSLLGRGGMGEIYLAVDTRLDRKVALKFLSSELATDETARLQLINEAKAAANLDHPNICQIHSIEDSKEGTFIVMQYIEGSTLGDLLRSGSIKRESLKKLIKQIVSALAHAHSHGILHRDIKPQNIMVTRDGQAKILDFGLAVAINKQSRKIPEAGGLKSGAVPGTIKYMSPEQLQGSSLDYRSDVFSLGTVLYELVSGTNPFARKRNVETVKAIQSVVPQPLTADVRFNRIGSVVQRCLAKNPSERYRSANEVLKALDRRATEVVNT